jgi:putative membrane protein
MGRAFDMVGAGRMAHVSDSAMCHRSGYGEIAVHHGPDEVRLRRLGMMWYHFGAGWAGWLLMSLAMVVFWAVVIALLVWAVVSISRSAVIKQPPSAAIRILQERLARGEISPEEFTQRLRLIQGARP